MDTATATATAWPAGVSRTLDWRCFQRGRCATDAAANNRKRLQLTPRGIELHHSRSDRSSEPSPPPSVTTTTTAALIAWRDILGAAVLTSEVAALVPGYTVRTDSSLPHVREFVVFGCLPQREALAWDAHSSGGVASVIAGYLGSVLGILSCLGRGSEGDAPSVSDCATAASPTATTSVLVGDTGSKPHAPRPRVLCERVLVQWVFQCAGDDAAVYVQRVVDAIQCLADPRTAHTSSLFTASALPQLSQRRYLVLVNPAGGAGRAQQIYDSVVAPVLQQSGVACDVVETQYQHHASTFVAALPLDKYDVIVAVGGDGLLSEIVQGLMKRTDWRDAIQHPLGIVPGGSGNGLAASLLHRSGEAMEALNAAFALAKGAAHELDLTSVHSSARGNVMYSFLSLEWAFIADVDVDSERYRMFGGLRFAISTLAKLLARATRYSGTLRYKRSDADTQAPTKFHDRAVDPAAPVKQAEARPPLTCSAPQLVRGNRNISDGSLRSGVDTGAEDDDEWEEITGCFHMFWAMNVSHAASDGYIAPGAALDDGYYYIMFMAGPSSRLNLVKLLLGLEDGSHIGKPQVQLVRTRAFTLTVENPHDVLCVDGERFAGPRLEVEVHRALGRIVCLAERR